MYKYKILVCGGTFDRFHRGHEAFLQSQLAVSEKVLIGITSDAFRAQYKTAAIESYEKRFAAVKAFLSSQHLLERVEMQKIDTVYIPKVWESYPIEAIAVTKDSEKGGVLINEQRMKERRPPLPFFVASYMLAEDGERISSSRIRNGEIDRHGKRFVSPEWLTKTLYLPSTLRDEIAAPLGTLFTTVDALLESTSLSPLTMVSIGDVVTDTLQKKKYGQKIAVVDLFVQRKKTYATIAAHHFAGDEETMHVHNPSGSITPQLFHAAKKCLERPGKSILLIDGEEDLAVLPFVLLAPLQFHILYGQPDQGIVLITVTEEQKQKIKKIVEKFTIVASD